ncbi:5057_t:CDS:1, partial [Gigaspora margarita]
MYLKKQAIFVSTITNNACIVEIYQESQRQKKFIGTLPNDVWAQSGFIKEFNGICLFGLHNEIIQNFILANHVPT